MNVMKLLKKSYAYFWHPKYGYIVGSGETHIQAIQNALILLANRMVIL